MRTLGAFLICTLATVPLLATSCTTNDDTSDALDAVTPDAPDTPDTPDTPTDLPEDAPPDRLPDGDFDVPADLADDGGTDAAPETTTDVAEDPAVETPGDVPADEVEDAVAPRSSSFMAWNNAALQAMATARMMPPPGTRALAMLHAAMYDAINSIEQQGQPYRFVERAPDGASAEAAAIQAAATVLTALFPDQADTFEALRLASLDAVPTGAARDDGVAIGSAAAAAILDWRAGDGASMMMGDSPYLGGTDPGEWRPTPPDSLPGIFEHWSMVAPFAMTSGEQFRPGPPPSLDSAAYAESFAETKAVGARDSTARTMDQGMMATFWVGMPGTIMEVGRMNLVVQQAAATRSLPLFELARLFALVNVAMADAAIAGLDCKYHYSAWRPVTAIREAASDDNPATTADAAWEPFLVTPAHPEYPSTHSALTRAATEILALFLGSDVAEITLPAFMDPNVKRSYASFSAVADEAGLGRIYGGIHFRFSYDAGNQIGRTVAQHVWDSTFQLR